MQSHSKAPPPIDPLNPGPIDWAAEARRMIRPPEWGYWLLMPRAHLWELIALALNIEPREFIVDNAPSLLILDAPEYRRWCEIFTERAADDFPGSVSGAPAHLWVVGLGEFAECARAIGMKLPAELSDLKAPQQRAARVEGQHLSLPPMSYKELAARFRYPGRDEPPPNLNDPESPTRGNLEAWREACSNPDRYGLKDARVWVGKRGSKHASRFDPQKIARWIVNRDAGEAYQTARALLDLIDAQDNRESFAQLRALWASAAAEA